MTKFVAMMVGMVVAGLMVPNIVHAQNVIPIQGTIQAADCQVNTLTLNASDGSHVFQVAPSTAVFVNSARTEGVCTLQQYIGSNATVWVTANGDQLLAGRVDVSAAPAPVVPEATPGYGAPYYGPDYPPYYAPYGPYYSPYFYGPIIFGPGDRDFRHDRDFNHDRDFHGGDRGGPRGTGNGGSQGGGMNGPSQGGGMNGPSHGGGMNAPSQGGGMNGGPHGGGMNGPSQGGGMNGGPHGGGTNAPSHGGGMNSAPQGGGHGGGGRR
jgi:hypothetical protein